MPQVGFASLKLRFLGLTCSSVVGFGHALQCVADAGSQGTGCGIFYVVDDVLQFVTCGTAEWFPEIVLRQAGGFTYEEDVTGNVSLRVNLIESFLVQMAPIAGFHVSLFSVLFIHFG
jgi:hypothetical protein